MAAWDSHTPKMNFGVKLQSGFGGSRRPTPPPGFKKIEEVTEVLDAQSEGEIAYIVGTKGANIIEIRNETKTSILTSKKGDLKKRFIIRGPEEGVRRAQQMIQQQLDFFRKKEQERIKRENEVTVRKEVALKLVGAIIGTKGDTVRSIQASTNTRIESPSLGELPIFEVSLIAVIILY
ncbi:MEX-3 protein [Aphelenchoides avenae]|nr:MEX-3 protein [Aphelenchus avenae]